MEKIEEIKKLKSLLDQGAITNEEYQVLKSNLISNGSNINSANITLEKENQTSSPVKKHSSKRKRIYLLPTILGIVAILIVSFFLIFNSEGNIKKQLISGGNDWIISNSENSTEGERIQFTESSIAFSSGDLGYKINWIDDTSFNLMDDNDKSNCKIKLRKVSDKTIQIAFLYDTENFPKNDEDWSNLQKNDRIMILEMIGKMSNENSTSNSIGGQKNHDVLSAKELFTNHLAVAKTYKLVLGEGQIVGKITKVDFLYYSNKKGLVFNIPAGKMWTPLFFEFQVLSGQDFISIHIPEIFTEQHQGKSCGIMYYYESIYDDKATNTWWIKDKRIYFPEKKDFVSTKLSKQNCKALSGMNAIYVSPWRNSDVKYILYFLEESI